MEKKLGVPIKKTGIRPELWISDEERDGGIRFIANLMMIANLGFECWSQTR